MLIVISYILHESTHAVQSLGVTVEKANRTSVSVSWIVEYSCSSPLREDLTFENNISISGQLRHGTENYRIFQSIA